MKPPSTAEIRRRVLKIVAGKKQVNPDTLTMYHLLRRSSGGIPGVGLDDQSIEELTGVFQNWLRAYRQKIGSTEVNNADKIKDISDLADLIQGKIKAAYAKRQAAVETKATEKYADLKQVPTASLTPQTVLALSKKEMNEMRGYLNEVLTEYGLLLPITVDEMQALSTLKDLFDEIKTELTEATKF